MVPLGGVEEALSSAIGVDATHIAVTAIPDTSKGERLIVLVSEPKPETELLRQQLLNLPATQSMETRSTGLHPCLRNPSSRIRQTRLRAHP